MSDGLYLDAELFALTARSSIEPPDTVLPTGAPFPGLGLGPRCTCCASMLDNGRPRSSRAIARWATQNGNVSYLCKACLDCWFDNADDDPDLEPASWSWLPSVRTGLTAPAREDITAWVRDPRNHTELAAVLRREARINPAWLRELIAREDRVHATVRA